MTSVMAVCEINNSFDDSYISGKDGNVLKLKLPEQICHSCGFPIADRYLLKVLNDYYHEHCLRCVSCDKSLTTLESCFVKGGQVFCKDDHVNFFIPKCARCCLPLQPNDIVHRSRNLTFHAHCFQCVYCGRQLKTGDQYFCIDGQVVCQQDYLFSLGPGQQQNNVGEVMFSMPQIPPFFADLDPNLQIHHRSGSSKKLPKRPRTILNSSQRKAFKIAFEKGPKPSKKIREQLAKETGLSVRVVQVWFQNQRAKIKKIQRKQEIHRQNSSQNSDPVNADGTMTSLESEPKSPSSLKSIYDSDSEDIEVDSGRSSSQTIQRQSSLTSLFSSNNLPEVPEKDPIDKLYHMQNTYFAYA
ncbi:hypothetical protein FO519_004738 [Halicephalobus sp. NKZ332]|nr:hypothetical protein FO519_004738 [Halicephalobus sp. NKZ332]